MKIVERLIDFKIRYIINHHFDRLSHILHEEFGKHINHSDAVKPPPGYIKIESYIRRRPNV
jgi:hypothetical protein